VVFDGFYRFIVTILFTMFRRSGVTDYYAVDDFHALHLAKQCIKNINYKKEQQVNCFI